MKFIHFHPDNRGIRSFKGIRRNLREYFEQVSEGFYESYYSPDDFIRYLDTRVTMSDVVLVTAHGGKESYLDIRESYDKPKKVFTSEHAYLFSNNFVFAISCYTSQILGQKVLEANGLVYIGFNDTIEEEFIFNNEELNKSLKQNVEKVFIQLYNKSISNALYKFVVECMTAIGFYQYLNLVFKKEISRVSKMSMKELNVEFSTDFKEDTATIVKTIINLEFINKFDIMRNKLDFLGEEFYVPWYFINHQDENTLEKILFEIEKMDDSLKYYKFFIQYLVYKKLSRTQAARSAKILFEQEVAKLKDGLPNILSDQAII